MKTWLSVLILVTAQHSLADQSTSVDYEHGVKEVLKERCYACHGVLKQESELRLDTVELMKMGGSSGPVIDLQNADASEILLRVRSTDDSVRMPPEGQPLEEDQIQSILKWIQSGAPAPLNEQPEEDPAQHWAFQPITRPIIPEIRQMPEMPIAGSSLAEPHVNPVDAFVLHRLQQLQLTPAAQAPPHVLLRRLYLDVIGVPPSRDELLEFLADPSPQAWSDCVDRLLDDPRYGERWGRHWMDVWRYSDWYGRRHVPDVWNSAPQIWRWRDWIVSSLNADLGYDAMIQQMLAGDEVDPENDQSGYATGFLIRNWYALNPNDWMRNTVEHTGKAFLGLTFNCAHCHDHKYDPILQDDYFRLRAWFEPIYIRQDRVPGEPDPGPFQDYVYSGPLRKVVRQGAVRIFDKDPDAPTWFYTGGDERNRVAERGSISPGVPDFLTHSQPDIQSVDLPLTAWYPGLRPQLLDSLLDQQRGLIQQAQQQIQDISPESSAEVLQLTDAVTQAEEKLESAVRSAVDAGRAPVIAGLQSLLLDATTGRRILDNSLPGLTQLPDDAVMRFQIRILANSHFNFQLAKDRARGLTAAFVAFDGNKIVSYHPGTFQEFPAGKYDFENGQQQFEVQLTLLRGADQCLLSVRCVDDQTLLVDQTPVARNGWNPLIHPENGIFLDARPGSRVMFDEFTVATRDVRTVSTAAAAAEPVTLKIDNRDELYRIDFEPPAYLPGVDVIGNGGWNASTIGRPPATSLVTDVGQDDELRNLNAQVQTARRALEAATAQRSRLERQVAAAEATIVSLQARAAADRAKYAHPSLPADESTTSSQTEASSDVAASAEDAAEQLAVTASRVERHAALLTAEAAVISASLALAEAERLPMDQADRPQRVESGTTLLSQAQQQLQSATAAVNDESLRTQYTPLGPAYPKTSSGRRRALAEWLTDTQNPLTARVAINHLWGRHFHVPIVTTVADFGRNGARPSHPELLDWLAAEFMESGWSMKHIHRVLLTSETWKRQSLADANSPEGKADPANRWLWRMNAGRMEAEVVRDSVLYCGGQLDFTQGGQELENDQALTTFRRSLYYSCNPENDGKSELGKLFDAPDPGDCYRRSQTIIPQQALALTNSQLVHDASQHIVVQVLEQLPATRKQDPEAIFTELFLRILSRSPTSAELAVCRAAYNDQCRLVIAQHAENLDETHPPRESTVDAPVKIDETSDRQTSDDSNDICLPAINSVARALLNHNDFITIR